MNEIIETYKRLKSYSKVSKIFDLSKQRIHQIVKKYRNFGRKNRLDIYNAIWQPICKNCRKEKTELLHHKDFNNENENIDNLIPLCRKCHTNIHIQYNIKLKNNYICSVCHRKQSKNVKVSKNLICVTCLAWKNTQKKRKTTLKIYRQVDYPKRCLKCNNTTIKNKRIRGICLKCRSKEYYSKHKEYFKKYYKSYNINS